MALKVKTYNNVQANVTFSKASSRVEINPTAGEAATENIALTLGKISKWYDSLVPTGGSSGKFLGWNSSGTAKWVDAPTAEDKNMSQTLKTDNVNRPLLMSIESTSNTTATVTTTGARNNSMYGNVSTGLIFCRGREISNVTLKTGNTAQSHITLNTLMTWLITSKQYIPSGKYCHVVLTTAWDYSNSDILQVSINGTNYEIQLAGVIIEFLGSATSYNAGTFRLLIHSSPTTSFTAATGYTKFPTATIAEYTCNGSSYSPVWKMILNAHPTITVSADTTSATPLSHGGTFTAITSVTRDSNGHTTKVNTATYTLPAQYSHPTYTERTKDIYKFHVNTTGHVDDASTLDANDVSGLLNKLTTGSSTPTDADYYISQYVGGGTTTTSYHRRPMSALWSYINGKISATTSGSGNAVTSVSYANGVITATKGSTFLASTTKYAGSSSVGGPANLLAYSHTNEINFSGGKQAICYFNYRDADTNAEDTGETPVSINYKFCDYRNSTAYTTITAANFAGNASTATKWKTARTLTIGSTGKSVDGSGNVSWSLSEIGAAPASHTHDSLEMKTLTASTIDTTAGTYGFKGTGLLGNTSADWAGFQVDASNDRFQLTANGQLLFRQNDESTMAGNWSAWVGCITPNNVSATSGIKVTKTTSSVGTGDGSLTYYSGVKIEHDVSTSADTTNTGTLSHGGTFTAITSVTRDSYGHVKTLNTKTYTLPGSGDTDTKVTQTAVGSTYTNYRPLVISASNADSTPPTATTVTDGTFITSSIYCQPSSGSVYATKFVGPLDVSRVTKDSKAFPGANKAIIEEYAAGSTYNLPSNHCYHIISIQGPDTKFGTQLALGMTTTGAYYRNYNNQTWSDWKNIINSNTTYGISGAYGANSNTWVTTITAGGSGATSTVPTATISAYGITKLYNGVDSTSTGLAATANAVKTAYDKANHSHPYLPLAGGTLTGALTLKGEQYSGNYGLDCANSDVIGVNSIRFADSSGNYTEGISFPRTTAGHWDTIWANGGEFYFTPDHETDVTGATSYKVLHTNNTSFTQTPISSGTKIGTITIAGTPTDIYAPSAPTVNNASLTLKGSGTTVTTFTANASTNQSLDIVAGSNVTITPDATNHKITIASSYTNTDTQVNVTLGTTTEAYLLATSTTPTNTAQPVTSIADTGVYLGTGAGSLYATTFYENGTALSSKYAASTHSHDELTSKALTASTFDSTSGNFFFKGSSLFGGTDNYDWVGIQADASNDKFQLVSSGANGVYYRARDDDSTGWSDWHSLLTNAMISGSSGITVTPNTIKIGGDSGSTVNTGVTISHSNSITAVTTVGFYKFKFDGQGHITGTASVNAADLPSHTHSQYYDSTTSRTANTVLAAPNGSNGTATFRKLVAADIPALNYSKVSISRNLTSGTKVGTITIDGTATDLYCQTNTDANVTQTATTTNADYEILFSATADNTTRTETARKNSNLKFNPSTGSLYTSDYYGEFECLNEVADNTSYAMVLAANPDTHQPNTLRKTPNVVISFKNGTASEEGWTQITLGNSTPSGTAGNETGWLKLYSPSSGVHYITGASTTSAITHTLPATTGTILNSGTTSFTQSLSSGTKIGSIKINGTSTDIYAPTNTDTKVTQTVSASSNTSFRPLLLGASWFNEGGAPSTVTDTVMASHRCYIQPSTGDITLYSPSGDSPGLIFKRGTNTDNLNDWKIYDKGGMLYFARNTSGSSTWTDYIYFDKSTINAHDVKLDGGGNGGITINYDSSVANYSGINYKVGDVIQSQFGWYRPSSGNGAYYYFGGILGDTRVYDDQFYSKKYTVASSSSTSYNASITGSFSANRNITIPDAAGTIPLITEIYNNPSSTATSQTITDASQYKFFIISAKLSDANHFDETTAIIPMPSTTGEVRKNINFMMPVGTNTETRLLNGAIVINYSSSSCVISGVVAGRYLLAGTSSSTASSVSTGTMTVYITRIVGISY